MKDAPLEPNLLSIFRLFLGIQFGLIVLFVLAHMHIGDLSGCPFCVVAVAAAGVLLLVGYLSWPRLPERLGRAYLPLALTFSIFLSLLIQNELIQSFVNPQEFGSDESAWLMFSFLFFPLVLVAWQYDFRTVVRYSFLSAGWELLILHFGNYEFFHQFSYQRSILVRTIVFLAVGYVISLIMQRQREQRQSLIEANRQLRHYAATLEQLAVTAAATRDAAAVLERMTASDGATIKRVHEITERLATAASAAKEAVVGLNSLFSAELRGLASVDAMLASQVQRIFLYAAALVLLLGTVLYVVLRASRRQANSVNSSSAGGH